MSMPPVLTEAASSRSRTTKSEKQKPIVPSTILETIEQHVLLDGFKVVVDLDKSRGSYLYNAVTNKRLIDLYGFFGSMPIGFNHPHFDDPAVQRDLLRAAKVKIANSDVYSEGYAEFVETFERVVGLPPLERYLFIEGGAPAVACYVSRRSRGSVTVPGIAIARRVASARYAAGSTPASFADSSSV